MPLKSSETVAARASVSLLAQPTVVASASSSPSTYAQTNHHHGRSFSSNLTLDTKHVTTLLEHTAQEEEEEEEESKEQEAPLSLASSFSLRFPSRPRATRDVSHHSQSQASSPTNKSSASIRLRSHSHQASQHIQPLPTVIVQWPRTNHAQTEPVSPVENAPRAQGFRPKEAVRSLSKDLSQWLIDHQSDVLVNPYHHQVEIREEEVDAYHSDAEMSDGEEKEEEDEVEEIERDAQNRLQEPLSTEENKNSTETVTHFDLGSVAGGESPQTAYSTNYVEFDVRTIPSSSSNTRTPQAVAPIRRSPTAWTLLWVAAHANFHLFLATILTFYHACMLYACVYSAYLSISSATASNEFILMMLARWLYLSVLLFRTVIAVGVTFYRVRYRALWVNQDRRTWPLLAMKVHWWYQACSLALGLMTTIPYLVLLCTTNSWFAGDSYSLISNSLLLTELVAYAFQLAIVLALCIFFPLRGLSPFIPFIPISPTFNASALKRRTQERSRRSILALKQRVFDPAQMAPGQEACCAVCLCEFEKGEILRELKCAHLFHKQCFDHWAIVGRAVCPLCIRTLSRTPSRRHLPIDVAHRASHSAAVAPAVELQAVA